MFDATIKVLIVDELTTMRKIIAKACRDCGFVVIVEATDGQIAWAKVCEEKPTIGLIISDWKMPNASGMDLLKRLRADSRFKHIPFMMVTVEAEDKQMNEALAAGVDLYLVKPIEKVSFKAKIEETLAKAMKRAAA
jgi:two-component system, chemotaxis family, chemotaxis protein CheY